MTATGIVQLVLRIAVAVLFLAMGLNHFRPKMIRAMAAMIPPWITRGNAQNGTTLVLLTGGCEVAGGIGILLPPTTFLAGLMLVLFLIAVFPANHYAAQHPDQFGRAAIAFWPRYFAQLALILVILLSIV